MIVNANGKSNNSSNVTIVTEKPTTTTVGTIGKQVIYNNALYICLDDTDGVYKWERINSNDTSAVTSSVITGSYVGDGTGTQKLAVNVTGYYNEDAGAETYEYSFTTTPTSSSGRYIDFPRNISCVIVWGGNYIYYYNKQTGKNELAFDALQIMTPNDSTAEVELEYNDKIYWGREGYLANVTGRFTVSTACICENSRLCLFGSTSLVRGQAITGTSGYPLDWYGDPPPTYIERVINLNKTGVTYHYVAW